MTALASGPIKRLGTEQSHYDISGVETPRVSRPRPTVEPPACELGTVPSGTKQFALLSGGNDSLVTTHYVMNRGWADAVVYADTNSGLARNIDFVRRLCADYGWPLLIVRSPMPLEIFAMRYGWPGATKSGHGWAYRYFKGRVWRWIADQVDGQPRFFTGARKFESGRRRITIQNEVQWESHEDGDFKGWWVSPLWQMRDGWMDRYHEQHTLPRNPITDVLHRSGDCFCMAFGHRNEVLVDLAENYPEHFYWLMNVERRVQEYRGRIELLADHDPSVIEAINEQRKEETPPYAMRMETARDHFGDAFDYMMAFSRGEAVRRASEEAVNWLGHGAMDSNEIRALVNAYGVPQTKLCEGCEVRFNRNWHRDRMPTPGTQAKLGGFE